MIDRRGGKEWEIAGIPQSMIDTFNKRSHEIEAEHRRRLADDPDYRPEYKHELAAKTRSRKQKELTPEELREAWDAQLTDDERDALASGLCAGRSPAGRQVTAAEAVAYAIHHCFERESVVAERELVRVALLLWAGQRDGRSGAGGAAAPGRDAGRQGRPADGDDQGGASAGAVHHQLRQGRARLGGRGRRGEGTWSGASSTMSNGTRSRGCCPPATACNWSIPPRASARAPCSGSTTRA